MTDMTGDGIWRFDIFFKFQTMAYSYISENEEEFKDRLNISTNTSSMTGKVYFQRAKKLCRSSKLQQARQANKSERNPKWWRHNKEQPEACKHNPLLFVSQKSPTAEAVYCQGLLDKYKSTVTDVDNVGRLSDGNYKTGFGTLRKTPMLEIPLNRTVTWGNTYSDKLIVPSNLWRGWGPALPVKTEENFSGLGCKSPWGMILICSRVLETSSKKSLTSDLLLGVNSRKLLSMISEI
ncbi:hypothetical protein J6590_026566 [Homalodisca vitripennis]|nr:hypothetical protein J6590_026566 [Homalodisca vitripennis]